MRPPFSYVPLLPLLVGYVCGILVGQLSISPLWSIVVIVVAVVLYQLRQVVYSILSVAVAIGWLNATFNAPQHPDGSLLDVENCYIATVESVNETETSRYIMVEVGAVKDSSGVAEIKPFKCSLTTPSYNPVVEEGDNVMFVAKVAELSFETDLPDERTSALFLSRQGVMATAFVAPEKLWVVGCETGLIWDIKRLRHDVTRLIMSSRLSPSTAEFLNATITGDDSMMTEDVRVDFSVSGLAHILALSGLHVGIIAIVIAVVMFPLYVLGKNRLRFVITIVLLWVYAVMTGLSPSVTRAVIMATVYLGSLILQRRHSAVNALCCAALVILVFSPEALFQVGFQLSFLAVASILLFANRLNPINPRRKVVYALFSCVTVSFSAMLATGVVVAYYFHQFPVYFLLSNVLVVFLLPFIVGGGVLIIVLQSVGVDAVWLCDVVDWLYDIIAGCASWVASLPGATIDNLYFPGWLLVPYFVIVACVLAAIEYRRQLYYWAIVVLAMFFIIVPFIATPRFVASEFFVPRDTNYTNIIYRNEKKTYLITTASPADCQVVYDRVQSRYRDYFGRRGVDTLIMVQERYEDDVMLRNGRIVAFPGCVVVIIDNNGDIMPMNVRPDYALVCRGFTGDIQEVYAVLQPDEILLSRDLNVKRLSRYVSELEEMSIPFRSLREQALHEVLMP